MTNQLRLTLKEAIPLIKEGDILLFQAPTSILSVGWWISKLTQSPYSHTGLATWNNGQLHIVEFREFKGSRNKPIELQFNENTNKTIDVYRIAEIINLPAFDRNFREFYTQEYKFTPEIARKITDTAKSLVGLNYHYWTIFYILLSLIPLTRLFINKDGSNNIINGYVCSTMISYVVRINFIDLVPFVADIYASPSDLARSSLLNYQFTVTK